MYAQLVGMAEKESEGEKILRAEGVIYILCVFMERRREGEGGRVREGDR